MKIDRTSLKAAVSGALIALGIYGAVLFSYWWSVQPKGSGDFIIISLVFWFLAILTMIVLSAVLFIDVCLLKSTEPINRAQMIACITALGVMVLMMAAGVGPLKAGWKIRRHYFERFAERSRPLVQAIEAFHKDHGRLPDRLNELVPRYLAAIPETGLPGDREYLYANTSGLPRQYPDLADGNPWTLKIPTATWGSFDYIFYYPLQNYPKENHSGRIERIADWAYCHE